MKSIGKKTADSHKKGLLFSFICFRAYENILLTN